MTPRQAKSLNVLTAEINRHAPNRSTASDGGLASAEHHLANPTSDHEPNTAGVWTAHDYTDDPAGGLDGSELAHLLAGRLGHHPAMMSGAYVIHNERIISFKRLDEGWRTYTGVNPHKTHVHVSVSDAAAGYDSTAPWNLWDAPPAKPSLTAERLTQLANDLNGDRTVSLDLLDDLIKHGTPADVAAAAIVAKWAIINGVRAVLRAGGRR